jgi:molybdenum-dependent DNA-binding transcriptional regulator ModE
LMASIITLMSDVPAKLKIDYKFWIKSDSGESIMGEGKWILLKNIKDTEEKIGFKLIEKSRGGAKGGQTVLTQKGEEIVAFFDKFYQNIKPVIESEIAEMQNELDRILK